MERPAPLASPATACMALIRTAALLAVLLASQALAAEARYVARFADGSRHEGNALINWHDANAQPQLEGRSLWEPANPFRWLRDRSLSPGPMPAAFVELVTGDRLPGSVVDYSAVGQEYEPLPAHFFVEPAVTLRPPQDPPRSTIRVIAAQVRRIVWQRRERASYQPGTLLLRDGRSLAFRAIRFEGGAASVLTSEGNRRISYNDLAEAHLPATDFWQRYFEELAVLSPQGQNAQGQGRLYQLETTDGLMVTSSKDRLAIHAQGGANEPHRWFHGVQPAWSLDVLWVPNEKVWLRRSFAPHEVPLSRIPPKEFKHESTLVKLRDPFQRDRNLSGEPLRSGAREWGFGFGATTTTSLTFDLPSGAKTLRGSIGLDRMAGAGGCAKGEILFGEKDVQKLWESPPLVGSDQTHDFGPLPFPAAEKPQLTLRADALHQGRPAGADPFEVRDFIDWLDPLVEFDPAVLQPLVRSSIPSTVPAWSQWEVDVAGVVPDKPPKFESVLDKRTLPWRYRTAVLLEQPLVLTRKITLSPHAQWLVMHLVRSKNEGNEPRLETRIGGELVSDLKIPADKDPRPLAVPLVGYQGHQRGIDVELRLISEPSSGSVEWRSIRTVDQLPTLYRVFEEENRFQTIEGGPPALDRDRGADYGLVSLKMPAGSEVSLSFEKPLRIREQPAWGEYRQILFMVRKKGRGEAFVELTGQGDQNRPMIYHLGKKQKDRPELVNVRDSDLPDEWIFMPRDLFADFGRCDLTSISLKVPDGEYALWDHIYFARDQGDFYQISKTQSPEPASRRADTATVEKLAADAKKVTALVDFGDGRIGNAVLTGHAGELLTAGHLLVAPNRDVTVTLPGGQQVPAKTRGIWRDADIGLLKIEKPGDYRPAPVNHWEELSTHQFYVAVAHARQAKLEAANVTAVDLRRVFKGAAWSTLELPDGLCGGGLFSPQGHLVGILSRYSPFGGAEYGLTFKLNEAEARLRNGEVWGKWRPGAGPTLGLVTGTQREGAKVAQVDAGGPAAMAGIQIGDLIVKVDGQAVHGMEDVYSAVAERDPGHEAALELTRNGQPTSVKLKLVPRTP